MAALPPCSLPWVFFPGRCPKQLRQHLGAPRPTAGMGRAVGLCGGDRCVGGLFLAPVDLARVILRSPASLGPNGLFYSIGGSPAVTLDPNGLFYAGSRASKGNACTDKAVSVGAGLRPQALAAPASGPRCRRVAVAPSWSRCFGHRRRRGPHVALLLRRRGHVAWVTVAPTLSRSCRSSRVVGSSPLSPRWRDAVVAVIGLSPSLPRWRAAVVAVVGSSPSLPRWR